MDTDGVFGTTETQAAPEAQQVEADEYLGYNDDESGSNAQAEGPESAPEDSAPGQPEPPAGESTAWEQERTQYQQAIQQYEATLGQMLQMFQTNPYAPQPGAQPAWASQVPVQPMLQAQAPVAPQVPAAPQVSDEELNEQFWQSPTKAAKTLLERDRTEWMQQHLLPQFMQWQQQFGQQVVAPLIQQVATVQDELAWRDRVTREHQSLRSQHEDFDQVAPTLRQMLSEDPQRFARLRYGQETLESLYQAAKQRAQTRPLAAIPGGKGAARMPRAGAARMQQLSENDAMVEAALGPMSGGGGVFG